MSAQQDNSQPYGGHAGGGHANNGHASNGFAMVSPPPAKPSKSFPLTYTASGGLLVGIVAGLLLISGGGDSKEAAAAGETEESTGAPGEEPLDSADSPPAEAEATGGADEEIAAGDGAGAPPEDGAELAPEVPEPITAMLAFEIAPPELADSIVLEVDGAEISADESFSLEFEPEAELRSIKVVAKAAGYRRYKKTIKVRGDMRIPIEMRPKSRRSRSGKRKHKRKDKPQGPGGLISL